MFKQSVLICFLLITSKAYFQQVITKQITSSYANISRTIKIALPKGYSKEDGMTYPLAIVLNGEYLFDLYLGNVKLYTSKNKAPQQIVVGIDIEDTFNEDIGFDRNTGELLYTAKRFYQFVRDEVLFYMQQNYTTSPFISLIADGYAANFISYFLGEPDAFINSYVFINPNFSEFIGDQFYNYNLERLANMENIFYIYLNNNKALKPNQQKLITYVQDGLEDLQISNVRIIRDEINTKYTFGSIAAAISNAIAKIFEIYAPITKEEYNAKIKDLSPEEAIAYLKNKYYEIDYLFGIDMEIRESDIAAVEGIVIDKENGDKLKDFGTFFLDIRPNSPLGDYYLGMYYEKGGELKKALKYYRKGFSKMDPSDPKADAFYENILRVGGH